MVDAEGPCSWCSGRGTWDVLAMHVDLDDDPECPLTFVDGVTPAAPVWCEEDRQTNKRLLWPSGVIGFGRPNICDNAGAYWNCEVAA